MGEKKKETLAINKEYLVYTHHLEKKRRQWGMDYTTRFHF
jgi:hypothetical protein